MEFCPKYVFIFDCGNVPRKCLWHCLMPDSIGQSGKAGALEGEAADLTCWLVQDSTAWLRWELRNLQCSAFPCPISAPRGDRGVAAKVLTAVGARGSIVAGTGSALLLLGSCLGKCIQESLCCWSFCAFALLREVGGVMRAFSFITAHSEANCWLPSWSSQ